MENDKGWSLLHLNMGRTRLCVCVYVWEISMHLPQKSNFLLHLQKYWTQKQKMSPVYTINDVTQMIVCLFFSLLGTKYSTCTHCTLWFNTVYKTVTVTRGRTLPYKYRNRFLCLDGALYTNTAVDEALALHNTRPCYIFGFDTTVTSLCLKRKKKEIH